jgi:anti-anti-sigma regulatory factor
MPYKISWIEDKRIIHTQLIGHLTTSEAQEISKLTTQYLDEGQSPVHIIIDVTEVQGFPTNLRQECTG